jgi:hypothetical protein
MRIVGAFAIAALSLSLTALGVPRAAFLAPTCLIVALATLIVARHLIPLNAKSEGTTAARFCNVAPDTFTESLHSVYTGTESKSN